MKTGRPNIHKVRIGNVSVLNHGRRLTHLDDPYHFVLKLTWPRFFAGLVALFVLINTLFGTLYWALPGSVANVADQSFFNYFFFSIETLATVGYGAMSPASTAGHIVASIEILTGMVGVALITGLVFARFAKPTSRFVFSDRALIRNFEGERVLMLRVANERYNRIVDASAKLSLIRQEINREGETYFRMYNLPLSKENTLLFALTWTLMHRIDESSPLWEMTAEQLEASRARIMVSVTGHDEIMAAEVRAIFEYEAAKIVFDGRFADVLRLTPEGERIVDLTRFHDVEPLPEANSTVAPVAPAK